MGETLDKNTSMKNKETLQQDIQVANKITGNDIFRLKTGIVIKFSIHGNQNIIGQVKLESSIINKFEGNIDSIKNIVESIIIK